MDLSNHGLNLRGLNMLKILYIYIFKIHKTHTHQTQLIWSFDMFDLYALKPSNCEHLFTFRSLNSRIGHPWLKFVVACGWTSGISWLWHKLWPPIGAPQPWYMCFTTVASVVNSGACGAWPTTTVVAVSLPSHDEESSSTSLQGGRPGYKLVYNPRKIS